MMSFFITMEVLIFNIDMLLVLCRRLDNEFSLSAQILLSSNFSSYFTAKDLAYVGDICNNTFNIVEKIYKLKDSLKVKR